MEAIKAHIFIAANQHQLPTEYLFADTKGLSLSENAFFRLDIECERQLPDGTHLWLGDFRFPLALTNVSEGVFRYSPVVDSVFSMAEYEKFTATFETSQGRLRLSKIFLNHFGKCEIELEFRKDDKEIYQFVCSVEVFSDKIKEIDGLLDYLFQKEFYFWNVVSLTKATASEEEKITDNIFWKLCTIRELCRFFKEEFLEQIVFSKITKLTPANKVKAWDETEVVSDASLLWYVENADALSLTTVADEGHFLIANRAYRSDVVFSETLESSTDVYENRLVHWFVNDIYMFLQEAKAVVRDKYDTYINKDNLLKYSVYTSFFKRMITIIAELESEIEFIKSGLDIHIPVSVQQIESIQDQRLHSRPHYREVYLNLVKWLENKQVNFYPDILFTGIKNVSKLYEVFCLFKIFDSLINDLNFKAADSSVLYHSASLYFDPFAAQDSEIASKYFFERGDVQLALYYDCLPGMLITSSRFGGKGFRPDFVFELTLKNVVYYYILDAKYKTVSNIESFEYNELTLKYLHGLSPISGGVFNAHALLVLNPMADSGVSFYHRPNYTISGANVAIPVIGRVEISVDPKSKDYLSKILEQLVSLSLRISRQ